MDLLFFEYLFLSFHEYVQFHETHKDTRHMK